MKKEKKHYSEEIVSLCFSRVACGMWQASLGSGSNRVEALSDYDNDAENNDNDASDLR